MTIEKEEKLLKAMGLVALFSYFGLTYLVKSDIVKLMFYVPMLLAMSILLFRKFKRDQEAGKDLTRYKILLVFVGISILMALIFIFYPNI